MNPDDFGRVILQKILPEQEVTRFIAINKTRTYTIVAGVGGARAWAEPEPSEYGQMYK
jgi:hypothetical protein